MGINNQPQPNGTSIGYSIAPVSSTYGSINGGPIVGSSTSSNTSNLPLNNSPLQSLCCLVENGIKCSRPSGNASYSKRIEKQVVQRKLRLAEDPHSSHHYICEYHKQVIQSVRSIGKRKRKEDDGGDDELHDFHDSSNDISSHPLALNSGSLKSYSSNSIYDIDLHTLQVNTLRRYKRHFRLSTKPGLNKNQLAEELSKHFRNFVVNEKEVINSFIYTIKSNGNKLDFNQNNTKLTE